MKGERGFYQGIFVAAVIPSLAVLAPSLGRPHYLDPLYVSVELIVIYIPSFVITALFAIPIFEILWKLKIVRWWSAALAGSMGAGIPALLLGLRAPGNESFFDVIWAVIVWGAVGATTALVNWALWKRGQPNQRFKPTSHKKPWPAA